MGVIEWLINTWEKTKLQVDVLTACMSDKTQRRYMYLYFAFRAYLIFEIYRTVREVSI